MKLLLDTHFLVWLGDEPERLNPAETSALYSVNNQIAVSAISIWEIRLKWNSFTSAGDRKLALNPDAALRLVDFLDLGMIQLTEHHAAARLMTPLEHRDPFDEMLLVQAQEEGMFLLTRDRLLTGHPSALTL